MAVKSAKKTTKKTKAKPKPVAKASPEATEAARRERHAAALEQAGAAVHACALKRRVAWDDDTRMAVMGAAALVEKLSRRNRAISAKHIAAMRQPPTTHAEIHDFADFLEECARQVRHEGGELLA